MRRKKISLVERIRMWYYRNQPMIMSIILIAFTLVITAIISWWLAELIK